MAIKKYKKSFRTKKNKRKKPFIISFLFLIILGGMVYLFLFSSVFKIKDIQVLGCEKLSAQEIKNIITEKINSNIFLANLNVLENYLFKKYPQIATINIKRKFPNVILARIEERKPVAVIGIQDLYFIDEEGVVFERSFQIPQNISEIKKEGLKNDIQLGETIIEKKEMENILKIINNSTVFAKEITIVSKNRINVNTQEGFLIYFNPEKNLDWQIEQLGIILKEEIPSQAKKNIEYIDLRFDKIYIYPKIPS